MPEDISRMTASEVVASQSQEARAEIKVKLIENAILVKAGPGWLSFETWEQASDHIGARIDKLKKDRAATPKGV